MKMNLPRFALLALFFAQVPFLHAADTTPPAVLSVTPAPGSTVSNLTQVTIVFSETVIGPEAPDLLLNGAPTNLRSGSSNTWTFFFSQPAPGLVQVTWDASHAIYDTNGNRFDELAAGSRWSYTLADTIAPTVLLTSPTPGSSIAALTQIEITFKESVTAVDASDLLINGQAASGVAGTGAGPYLFSFPQPTNGSVTVTWAGGHGITDTAPVPNAFAGGLWSYTLNSALTADIVLNEIMAENLNGLTDEDGDTADWLELFNRGTNNVSLLGWSLTDDPGNPGQWIFPNITLNAGQYLLVLADGKDRATIGPLTNHANFNLGVTDYLGLYNSQSPRLVVSEFSPSYPEQRGDISWGRTSSNTFAYFATATPNAANSSPTNYSGFVALPHASAASGLFSQPFQLALGCETPGAAIYFTTNNDVPTPTNGTLYTGLITIAGSSNKAVIPVRAAAFKAGLLPSSVLTHTYVFPDQVVFQPFRPAGFPATWVSEYTSATADTPGDYEMDPQVLTNGANIQIVRQALAEIPTVSLVTSINTAFAPTNGVYSGRRKQGNQRPVNAEMWLPNGEHVFHVDCGFEIQGGSSPTDASGDWKDKKLSMRLIFKGDFGTPKLHAKVFDDTPIEEFDTLILDAGLNWWWTHMTDANQRERAKFITDTVTSDLMNNAGMVAQHTRFVHLYLDGLYWGLYWLHERMDEAAAASYLGGQKEEWDVLKHTDDAAGLQNGTLVNYNAMLGVARSGLANNANYEQLQTVLDVPWFADYMIVNLWVGNTDWPQHNWYAWHRTRFPGALPWRFVSWDAEHTIESVNDNRLGVSDANSPGELFQLLRNNTEFKVFFGDHVHKLLFNGGPLFTKTDTAAFWTPTNPSVNLPGAAYRKRVDEIWNSIVCESARWGDVATANANNPYTRDTNYLRELNALFSITNVGGSVNYFPLRGSNVLQQFRAVGLYPTVAAPSFSQFGGRVAAGYNLFITNLAGAGTVYYTTNSADPRVYGLGSISPQAVAYGGTPVVVGQTMVVKARALVNGTNWSALNEATFTVGALGLPLRITEIMYNPLSGPGPGNNYEFIELMNTGPTDLQLGKYSFEGISFAFPLGYTLAAGARIVLANGSNPSAFAARYPGVAVAGYFGDNLNNGGERIAIKDFASNTVTSVDYDDQNGWPAAADGLGYSLEIIDVNGNPDDPANWRASSAVGGTPGLPNSVPAPPAILLNEVMADNVAAVLNVDTYPDWVELYNAGTSPVDLGYYSLSIGGDPRQYVIPGATLVPVGGYKVFWCDTNSAAPGLHTGFTLGRKGESLFLYDPNTNRIDAISFGLQVTDASLGRVGGVWQLTTPTPGATNVAAVLAASSNLVINEWLANAPAGGIDWVELFNRSSDAPVALRNTYLGTSNDLFQIKSLSFLPPQGYIQLFADKLPGPDHLDFNLHGPGDAIICYDETGGEISRVTFAAQVEGITQGRLPDGAATIMSFPGTASPGTTNYLSLYTGPMLNEVLARNVHGVTNSAGRVADYIELYNPNPTNFVLAGMSLSVDKPVPGQWVFPPGTTINAQDYLLVWCDGGLPASTVLQANLNLGHTIDGDDGAVFLFNTAGQLMDSVEFGFQIQDLSLGRVGAGWRLLNSPTPGVANAAPAVLGSVANLRINEWMAASSTSDDWFEVYNLDILPVSLSGLFLTDDPSIPGQSNYLIAPLTFIAGNGFVKWVADGTPSKGRDHVNFNLDALGETIRLYNTNVSLIDGVDFGPQLDDVSQGRLPDGGATIVSFPSTPTPEQSNYLPLPNAKVNEALTHTDPPLEDAIEVFNPTPVQVTIGGWFLSNSQENFKKYRIPNGTTLPPGGFLVFYENQFNANNPGVPFTLNSAHGDQVWLSAADGGGALSGYRALASFGAAENGVSFGRFETSVGPEFAAMSARSFGVDNPATVEAFRAGAGTNNPYPKIGPVIINELMYHPPDIGGVTDDTLDEYIELYNVSGSNVLTYDPAFPTNQWRLQDGVSFTFPNITITNGNYVLVVSFDPIANPAQLTAFRTRYGLSSSALIYGPYTGKLDNGGEAIELVKPDAPQAAPHPDAGFVPYIRVDRVAYSDDAPWPSAADGNPVGVGLSLQRRVANAYGNDPLNWLATTPTPGASNGAAFLTLPAISQQPQNTGGMAGTNVSFTVSATGDGPLTYQWRFNGMPLAGATNATLALSNIQSANEGNYAVFISNPAGSTLSATATLTVAAPPNITQQPQNQVATPGATVTFAVLATGGGLTYQWRFYGTNLAGATNSTLTLTNVQSANTGPYSVLVVNLFTPVTSDTAYLVLALPAITTEPQGRTNFAGSTVTLTVGASGDAPLAFQWRKNGGNLPGATNSSLVLANAQVSDSGAYTAVAFNPAGSATSIVATVRIVLPLVISQQPTNLFVLPGVTAAFNVTATGQGTLFYQWRFNGVNITNNATATTPSLSLTNVQLTNNGPYSVLITDDLNSLLSTNATLTVKVSPVITQHPLGLTVAAGSNATFAVTATGTLPMGFRWRKGAITVSYANYTNVFSNTSFFTVTNAQPADAVGYTVIVTNIMNPAVASSNGFLTVVTPPTDQTAVAGSNVTFNVTASGVTRTLYQWRFNGTDIPDATNTSLTLSNVQQTNAGLYAVVVTAVTNAPIAPATFSATLSVLGQPMLSEPGILPDGNFRMRLVGNPNQSYAIEISSDLTNWSNLATLVYTNGGTPYIDITATNSTQRFYRARAAP